MRDYSSPYTGTFARLARTIRALNRTTRTAAAPAGYAIGTIILWGVLAPLATSASIRHCSLSAECTAPLRSPGQPQLREGTEGRKAPNFS